MEEFNTIEKCLELFKSVNCIGNENLIFFTYKDTSKAIGPSVMLGGAVGAFAGGYVNGAEHPYDGLLINKTENGIGMFMLKQSGVPLTLKLEKMELQKDQFIFYKNEDIKEIKVKKFALLNNKKKSIFITTSDKKKYVLCSDVNEPRLPYHNDNFSKFIEKYSAK
ncbi:MAG: hypothetical protein J6I85_07860 [Clostridia bacterium]|nr:hypothetical protein [Clostridia bacterium]